MAAVNFNFKPSRAAKLVGKRFGDEATRALQKEGLLTVNDIKRQMSGKKSGRIYRSRASGKVKHQAGAPGEAPAVDTGAYRNAIASELVRSARGGAVVKIGIARASRKRGGGFPLDKRAIVLEATHPHFEPAFKRAVVRLRKRLKGLGRR